PFSRDAGKHFVEVDFRAPGEGVTDILPVKDENSHALRRRRSSQYASRSARVWRGGTSGFHPVAARSFAELPTIFGASSLRLRVGSKATSGRIPLNSERRSTIFLIDTDVPEQIL